MYRLKRSELSYILMTLSLIILAVNYICYQTLSLDNMKNMLRIVAIFFALFSAWIGGLERIFLNRMDLISLFIAVSTFITSGFNTLNFVVILVLVICMKNYNIAELIRMSLIANMVAALVYFMGYFMGVIQWKEYSIGGRVRNTLGFINVNAASLFVLSFVIVWIIENSNRFRWVIGSLLMIAMYYMTNSRTAMVGYFLFVLFYLYFRCLRKLGKWGDYLYDISHKMLALGIILFALLPFLATIIMRKFPGIDILLSNRLSIIQRVMDNMTPKEFFLGGVPVEIDNSYVNFLLMGGIVLFLFIVFLIIWAIWKKTCYKDYNYKVMSIAYSVLVMGMMESFWVRPEILISLVFWKYIYDVIGKKI